VTSPRYSLVLLAAVVVAIAAPDAPDAPTRDARRQQIRRALWVPDLLPALEVEQYGQVEIAPGVIAERVSGKAKYVYETWVKAARAKLQ
jgi:hypothetical protein